MSGYRIDTGVPFLINDAGQIVGYVDQNGKERVLGGSAAPVDTPEGGAALALSGAGSSSAAVISPQGLLRWRRAYDDCLNTPARINVIGNSVPYGIGSDGTAATSDQNGDSLGWVGQLRTLFNKERAGDGGGFINSKSGWAVTWTNTSAFSDDTVIGPAGYSRAIKSGDSLSFVLPACTAFDIVWYNNDGVDGGTVTGGWQYQIDGGVAVPITAGVGQGARQYKIVSVTGLANTAHTILVSGTNATLNVRIVGVAYHNNKGVVVSRFGVQGWSLLDIIGQGPNNNVSLNAISIDRLVQAAAAGSPNLVILTEDINAWRLQATPSGSNPLPTPTNYETALRTLCAAIVAKGACVLILSQNQSTSPTAPANGFAQAEYWAAAQRVAATTSHVAQSSCSDLFGSWATSNANGLMVDVSHPTRSGHGGIARSVKAALSVIPQEI